MAGFDVWSVIKVPVPYTNRPVRQRRPALVIARRRADGAPDMLWVLMITSARNRAWAGDVEISDVSHAGLTAASRVRCAKVATIEAADAETIGSLPAPDRAAVRAAVADALDEILGDRSRRL